MTLRLAVVLAGGALAACGGASNDSAPAGGHDAVVSDTGPQHVHGLGVDPADGTLFVATHTGLWRAPAGESKAERVGDVRHDLMGFTVVGSGSFLASGHPDGRHDLPPQLGLQRSVDGGRSWQTVSLLGEVDLHVLRAAGRRVYGVDSGTGAFIASDDGGASWDQRVPPAPVFDLAVAPDDDERLVAVTERGLFSSADAGRTWRPLAGEVAGLLAWPARGALYVVDPEGAVWRSSDGGRRFSRAGDLNAPPQAFAAAGARELYAAVDGGKVLMSGDGGRSWRTRASA